MKSIKCYMLFIMVLLVGMSASETVDAQAFCSIRDPNMHLKNMFPDNKSHTELILDFKKTILDPDLIGNFPDFDLSEFGAHSIFKVYNDAQMIGTLQSLSVLDRWGLTEVVIALDRDGALIDYDFQRCRNKWAQSIKKKSVKDTLQGKVYSELLRKYSELRVVLEKDSENPKVRLLSLVVEAVLKAGILHKKLISAKGVPAN